MPTLSLNDLVAIGLCVLALLALGMNLLVHRKHPYIGLRKTSAVRSSEILSQATAEQGKRLTIGLGLDVADSVTAMANLPMLAALTRRSIFTDQPVRATSGGGTLASLSQSVVRGTYQGAVAPELFKIDYALLAGLSPYAYLAGLLPQAASRANAGIMLYGPHRPESLLAADLAERKGNPVIALTSDLSAQQCCSPARSAQLGEDISTAGQLAKFPWQPAACRARLTAYCDHHWSNRWSSNCAYWGSGNEKGNP
jgi:hypothetical protein